MTNHAHLLLRTGTVPNRREETGERCKGFQGGTNSRRPEGDVVPLLTFENELGIRNPGPVKLA
jgi:hypothetical protein